MTRTLTLTATEEAALDAVIAKARALFDAAGAGPVFTAAVVAGNRIVTLDRNEVDRDNDPSRHAEIVAMARAAAALGRRDLSGATLIASMQPCEMCLAAMRWAGIDRLLFAMTQAEAPAFFRFPGLTIDDFARAADTPFAWQGGLRIAEVRHIYASGA
ncbi:nucleoside deaminase [Roseivivax sp. CAU 1753]